MKFESFMGGARAREDYAVAFAGPRRRLRYGRSDRAASLSASAKVAKHIAGTRCASDAPKYRHYGAPAPG